MNNPGETPCNHVERYIMHNWSIHPSVPLSVCGHEIASSTFKLTKCTYHLYNFTAFCDCQFCDLQVKTPLEVLGMDLMGPLPETTHKNKSVPTMTDLYTKRVSCSKLWIQRGTDSVMLVHRLNSLEQESWLVQEAGC